MAASTYDDRDRLDTLVGLVRLASNPRLLASFTQNAERQAIDLARWAWRAALAMERTDGRDG